eukprot:732245-Hanusia_phi.AAC.1
MIVPSSSPPTGLCHSPALTSVGTCKLKSRAEPRQCRDRRPGARRRQVNLVAQHLASQAPIVPGPRARITNYVNFGKPRARVSFRLLGPESRSAGHQSTVDCSLKSLQVSEFPSSRLPGWHGHGSSECQCYLKVRYRAK